MISAGENNFDDYEIDTSNAYKDFQEGYKMQSQETYESESKKENQNKNKKEILKENTEVNGNAILDGDRELLQNQTIKQLEKYNKELKEKCDKLEESNEKEIKNSKQLEQKVKDLENQLSEEKKKNENLEKELENAKKNQNSQNSEKIEKSEKNENSVSSEEKDQLVKNILEKDKEIAKLKAKLEETEKDLISIIFINEEKNIHFSLVVKMSDKLNISENKLIEKFPILEDDEYDFYFKEKKVNKKKTFKENNLDNGSILTLKIRD